MAWGGGNGLGLCGVCGGCKSWAVFVPCHRCDRAPRFCVRALRRCDRAPVFVSVLCAGVILPSPLLAVDTFCECSVVLRWFLRAPLVFLLGVWVLGSRFWSRLGVCEDALGLCRGWRLLLFSLPLERKPHTRTHTTAQRNKCKICSSLKSCFQLLAGKLKIKILKQLRLKSVGQTSRLGENFLVFERKPSVQL